MKEKTTDAARMLGSELNVLNVGLEIFYNALKLQDIKVLDVNWNPPPKLEKETQDLLDKML
ncbi:MAG: fdrA domain protein [Nitrososphaerales archaeon]